MKMTELVTKTDKELQTLLTEETTKLGEARMAMRTKQVTNVKEIAARRTMVARIKTLQRERALTAQEANHE